MDSIGALIPITTSVQAEPLLRPNTAESIRLFFDTTTGEYSGINSIGVIGAIAGGGGGSIATDGSSLYSTDPATSGFSTDNGIFFGSNAGNGATNAIGSVFLGSYAGYQAVNSASSNFIGWNAGRQATITNSCNFIGWNAGQQSSGNTSNAIGLNAGRQNTGTNLVAIGTTAGTQNTGTNVIALGNQAGYQNQLSGQTIISLNCLPQFANHAAATLAINAGTGATKGFYLFYHTTNQSIDAVLIP